MAVQSFLSFFLYTCAPPSPPKAYAPPTLTFFEFLPLHFMEGGAYVLGGGAYALGGGVYTLGGGAYTLRGGAYTYKGTRTCTEEARKCTEGARTCTEGARTCTEGARTRPKEISENFEWPYLTQKLSKLNS